MLSGTGTNGTAGAQAIKAAGGLCIAQAPDTAEFTGMPQSLIHAGYADQVLRIEEMAAVLQRYVQHPYLALDPAGHERARQELESHQQRLREVLAIVRSRTGHDFAPYRIGTVLRRIQRRMGLLGMTELDRYCTYLRDHPMEMSALANDLLINVTGFFRDPEAWEALRESVVRPLIAGRASGDSIRAWVAACASGEEAYSLAMLIAEESERAGKAFEVKIFATDAADKSLALARAGVYPGGIEGNLSSEHLQRFFERDEHTYRIKKVVRDQVVFAPQNLLRDPPFSRVDIVTCRNLLIYLEPEAQRRTLALIHFALAEGGYLLLGSAESIGQAESLFEVVSKRWRIYRRAGAPASRLAELPKLAPQHPEVRTAWENSPATLRAAGTVALQAALLEEFVPPTAIVDANQRLVYFQGDGSPFLAAPSGEVTQNFLEMVRPPLRSVVRTALRKALLEKAPVTVQTKPAKSGAGSIVVTVAPFRYRTAARQQFRVTFAQVSKPEQPTSEELAVPASPQTDAAKPADAMLEEELHDLRRALQSNEEAFEAANEELKASNEEVTSINEELQSSNEELETSKEELQALNEELTTVNSQLQTKVLELESLTGDLDNLLSSTDIAVVFLDGHLNVRRFTPAIRDLLELIPADIGWPLANLAQKFTDGNLLTDAAKVLAKLAPLESEVLSDSGRWYLRRTLPYRTEDHHIAGVVITFIDVTSRKHAAQQVEAERETLRAVIEQMPAAVLMVEAPSGKLLFANRQAATLFNQPFPLPFIGRDWTAVHSAFIGLHSDRRPYEASQWPLARALKHGEIVLDEELHFVDPLGGRRTFSMSAGPIHNMAGESIAAVTAFWDITDRKSMDERLQEALQSAQQLRSTAERANRAKDEFIATVSHELRTPLNTIRLWARMLVSGKVHEEEVIKGGRVVDRAALAQQQLIDDLLDVTRMASGQLRLAKRDVALLPLIKETVESVRPVAAERRITLTAELSSEVGIVCIDPERLQQVIWNLLANAVKFTSEGGRVEVRLRREDGTVEVEVTDDGVGIRPEFIPHVFDRFRQAETGPSRRYGGLGLGLAIAKQLVELHGGTIRAHSEGVGRGARFTVYLPLERRYGLPDGGAPYAGVPASNALQGIDVLLVDDEAMAREATGHLLEQYGAQVRTASSAARAREAFTSRRPDAIVADIGMPDEDGHMLIQQLRRIEQEQHTFRMPAIAVTAFARGEDRDHALNAGFDEYLPKPVDPERLVRLIVQLVQEAKGRS